MEEHLLYKVTYYHTMEGHLFYKVIFHYFKMVVLFYFEAIGYHIEEVH